MAVARGRRLGLWLVVCLLHVGCVRFGYNARGKDGGAVNTSAGHSSDHNDASAGTTRRGDTDSGADASTPHDGGHYRDAANLDPGGAQGDGGSTSYAADASLPRDASAPFMDATGDDSPDSSLGDAAAPGVDASTSTPMDAAVESQPDAGGQADAGATDAGSQRQCAAGREHGGYCWFLGAAGESCDEACQSHDGYEPSLQWTGSLLQGGSLARCDALLTLLTGPGTTTQGTRYDQLGLGCHLYSGRRWWLYSPRFDPAASTSKASIVCSCFDR